MGGKKSDGGGVLDDDGDDQDDEDVVSDGDGDGGGKDGKDGKEYFAVPSNLSGKQHLKGITKNKKTGEVEVTVRLPSR